MTNLEIEPRGVERSPFPRSGNQVALSYVLSHRHQPLRYMPIDGKIAVSVVHDNHLTVTLEPIAEDHPSVEHGMDFLAGFRGDINAGMRHDGREAGMTNLAEGNGHAPPCRPGEYASGAGEAER